MFDPFACDYPSYCGFSLYFGTRRATSENSKGFYGEIYFEMVTSLNFDEQTKITRKN